MKQDVTDETYSGEKDTEFEVNQPNVIDLLSEEFEYQSLQLYLSMVCLILKSVGEVSIVTFSVISFKKTCHYTFIHLLDITHIQS